MAITYGFYNSLNHDRMYNAEDVSSFFDGLITDGVYLTIGNCFSVKPSDGMEITVDTGRAWFNHTWTLNTTLYPLEVEEANIYWDRIDAVVIEVDASIAVRANTIKIVKGTPAQNPERPTMIDTEFVHQYPIAYIDVHAGATEITMANIRYNVGTSECPYVIGVVTGMNADDLIAQMEAQWEEWYATHPTSYENQWTTWYGNTTGAYSAEMANYRYTQQAAFDAWFEGLIDTLDGDVAANLAQQINELRDDLSNTQEEVESITSDEGVAYLILDDDEEPIIDDAGNPILGSRVFAS